MFQHFICDPIRSQGLLLLHLFQRFFKLSGGQAFGHGSKPALAVFWSTARVWVLTFFALSAKGEAVLSSSKTLAMPFGDVFPVTAPLVVCSALSRSELSPFSDFVSCQSSWESLSMLRDAVFVFQFV